MKNNMIRLLKVIFCLSVFSIPVISSAVIPQYNCEEMWWCDGCGLIYPASTKRCQNADCPMYDIEK